MANMRIEELVKNGDYSSKFDELRANRCMLSTFKYGHAKQNFGWHLVDALGSMQKCIDKYNQTGNTEYLCDAANYLMFEFMYPQKKDAKFEATDSKDSAGIVGISIKEMEAIRNEDSTYLPY